MTDATPNPNPNPNPTRAPLLSSRLLSRDAWHGVTVSKWVCLSPPKFWNLSEHIIIKTCNTYACGGVRLGPRHVIMVLVIESGNHVQHHGEGTGHDGTLRDGTLRYGTCLLVVHALCLESLSNLSLSPV